MRFERWQVVHAVLGFVALAVLVGVLTASINLFKYSELAKHGTSTQGVVTETRCSQHNAVLYEFQFQDSTFGGSTSASYVAPSYSMVHAGDHLHVRFLLADPSVNAGGDFPSAYRNERETVLVVALLIPSFFTAVVVFRVRRGRSWTGV